MKITFVIAEYNPFHTGHLFQLRAAKEQTNADKLAVIMSGSVTERGDFAVCGKRTRAAWAKIAGADAVLELPTCYALNNAEKFSLGAMKIVSAFSKNNEVTLSFGSECGDVKKIRRAAEFSEEGNELFTKVLKERLAAGDSYPLSRHKALASVDEETAKVLSEPNNILAVEYVKAAQKLGLDIAFHTVKRQNDYNSTNLEGAYASATAIRSALFSGDVEKAEKYLPKYVSDTLPSSLSNRNLSALVLYDLNAKSKAELEALPEVSEGLENRLKSALAVSSSYESLVENVKTKRYTMAKIKRILLYSLLKIDKTSLRRLTEAKPYFNFLEADADILKALAATGEKGIVKLKDAETLDEVQAESFRLDRFSEEVRNVVYP